MRRCIFTDPYAGREYFDAIVQIRRDRLSTYIRNGVMLFLGH